MAKEMYRNFTAILPVTCNANCVFCPEKEMKEKANKAQWLEGLVNSLFKNRKKVGHVSISGGEPTLNVKLLQQTIDTVLGETHIKRIGLTSNGQFLESSNKTLGLLNALIDGTTLKCKLDFMNISMHSFDSELNMEIMGLTSMFDLDALVRFRKMLGRDVSFHINFVICKQNIRNIKWEMTQAREFMRQNPHFDIVFRVDYSMKDQFEKLHKWAQTPARKRSKEATPRLAAIFNEVFNNSVELKDDNLIGYCPSCFTLASYPGAHNTVYLKASAYEPNEVLGVASELVYHMNGKLYFDWSRKQPVYKEEIEEDETEVKPLPGKTKQAKSKAKKKPKSNSLKDSMELLRVRRCGFSGTSCRY